MQRKAIRNTNKCLNKKMNTGISEDREAVRLRQELKEYIDHMIEHNSECTNLFYEETTLSK